MPQPMTEAERDHRHRLIAAVNVVRDAVARVPDVGAVDHIGLNEAGAKVLEANSAVRAAQQLTDELAELERLSEEGLLLVGSARVALEAIRSLLALLAAELDHRAA